jgi:hypothetical protein
MTPEENKQLDRRTIEPTNEAAVLQELQVNKPISEPTYSEPTYVASIENPVVTTPIAPLISPPNVLIPEESQVVAPLIPTQTIPDLKGKKNRLINPLVAMIIGASIALVFAIIDSLISKAVLLVPSLDLIINKYLVYIAGFITFVIAVRVVKKYPILFEKTFIIFVMLLSYGLSNLILLIPFKVDGSGLYFGSFWFYFIGPILGAAAAWLFVVGVNLITSKPKIDMKLLSLILITIAFIPTGVELLVGHTNEQIRLNQIAAVYKAKLNQYPDWPVLPKSIAVGYSTDDIRNCMAQYKPSSKYTVGCSLRCVLGTSNDRLNPSCSDVDVISGQYSDTLIPFFYNSETSMCDINGINSSLHSSRVTPLPNSCGSLTTLKGRTLYYSNLNVIGTGITVKNNYDIFYFRYKDGVVTFNTYNNTSGYSKDELSPKIVYALQQRINTLLGLVDTFEVAQ